ncbi:MAG: hypothetical protein WBV19_08255, partial [Candidatus Macondimonas sp.]
MFHAVRHLGAELANGRASGGLGGVHGGICILEQDGDVRAIFGVSADAQAQGNIQTEIPNFESVRHRLENFVRFGGRRLLICQVWDHNDEFISPGAGNQCTAAQAVFESFGHRAEELVTH